MEALTMEQLQAALDTVDTAEARMRAMDNGWGSTRDEGILAGAAFDPDHELQNVMRFSMLDGGR